MTALPPSSSGTDQPAAPSKPLMGAVQKLLRPLVRLLIAKGIGLPAMTEILKEAYVDVAAREFPVDGKRQTDSRISLLTGVHRKDVKRLREAADKSAGKTDGDNDAAAPRSIGIGAHVVARWVGSAATTDDQGRPLPLPRTASTAGGPSFDALVEGVSKDVRPRAVLDEWIRLGVARLDEQGRVHLNQAAFVPEKGFDEKAFYLGRNIHDHLAAAARNLLNEGNPVLERSVHYSDLTPESVARLADAAEREGMRALLSINRMALELAAEDKGRAGVGESGAGESGALGPGTLRRMNFGLYFHEGPSIFNTLGHGDGAKAEDAGE